MAKVGSPTVSGKALSRTFVLIALVFALFGASYACFLQNEYSYNVICRAGLAVNLVQNGRVDINDYQQLTRDKAVRDGVYYCDKAPGMSFLATPAAFAFTHIRPITGATPRAEGNTWPLFLYLCTLTASAFWTALAAAILFAYLLRRTNNTNAALIGAIAFGFATPIWGWATSFFGHATAGALLLIGYIALDTAVQRGLFGKAAVWTSVAAGLALGASVAVEYTSAIPAAIICAAIGLHALRRDSLQSLIRPFGIAAIAAGIAIIPVLVYHNAAFGSPFTTGYRFAAVYQDTRAGFFGIGAPDLGVLARLIFGLQRGIIWYAPIVLPAAYGAYLCVRNNVTRTAAIASGLILVWYLVMNAGFAYWTGGASTGPRYVTPAFAFVALVLGLSWPLFGVWARRATLALLAVSVFLNLAATAVDMTVPEEIANPLFSSVLPRFFAGALHETMVYKALKHDGFIGLAPLLVIWAGFGWLIWREMKRAAPTTSSVAVNA